MRALGPHQSHQLHVRQDLGIRHEYSPRCGARRTRRRSDHKAAAEASRIRGHAAVLFAISATDSRAARTRPTLPSPGERSPTGRCARCATRMSPGSIPQTILGSKRTLGHPSGMHDYLVAGLEVVRRQVHCEAAVRDVRIETAGSQRGCAIRTSGPSHPLACVPCVRH